MRGQSYTGVKVLMLMSMMLILFPYCASAEMYTGNLQGVQGSIQTFYWGDGKNDLCETWSVNNYNYSGWFYGPAYSGNNASVYVYSGLSDPTTVSDASVFNYFDSSTCTYPGPWGPSWAAWAKEGDTVFFHGKNGKYGAWYIKDIYYDPTNKTDYAALNGTWYFLDDGSSDFTSSHATPIPAAIWLFGSGFLGLLGLKRKNL